MQRGRPIRSEIRQNIVELIYHMGEGYGYDIYKNYIAIFPKVTMRSIYYHLKKGLSLEEFKVKEIKKVEGNFSWGTTVEKKVYKLGDNARALGNIRIKEYFDNKIPQPEPMPEAAEKYPQPEEEPTEQ